MSKATQPGTEPQPAYTSIDRFCQLTGIGRTKAYEALRDGHLRARKLGTKTLIDVKHGLAWIEALPAYTPQ